MKLYRRLIGKAARALTRSTQKNQLLNLTPIRSSHGRVLAPSEDTLRFNYPGPLPDEGKGRGVLLLGGAVQTRIPPLGTCEASK